MTSRLCAVSAMKSRPPATSASTLPGKSRGVSSGFSFSGKNLSGVSFSVFSPRALRHVLADHPVEQRVVPLAGGSADVRAVDVDEHERRPAPDMEAVPDHLVGVVDHRVLDPVLADLAADVLGVALGEELGGVDADHDQLVLVFLLELGEVGQDVVAVDAAVGPEVEQDDLAAELLHADRPGRVEPAEASRQAGPHDLGRSRPAAPARSRPPAGGASAGPRRSHQESHPHRHDREPHEPDRYAKGSAAGDVSCHESLSVRPAGAGRAVSNSRNVSSNLLIEEL